MQLTSPVSEADYDAYYELRWKILRAPWNQPRGSERDDREADSTHLMVVEGNGALDDEPTLINTDPYGKGWIAKIRLAAGVDLSGLMTAEQYEQHIKG